MRYGYCVLIWRLCRPPGTGKTKTIVGLIGALIASADHQVSHRGKSGKVLLCAPSNAAVDEVAKRLKAGIRGSDGNIFYPKVVRIGSESSVEVGVRDIFIDELILQEIGGTSFNGENPASIATKQQLEAARRDRSAKQAEYDAVENNAAGRAEIFAELKKIKSICANLSSRFDSERDQEQQSKRAMELQKVRARSNILAAADVICSTLSGSGHDYMNEFDFETVIIDEAAQSIELSSLIPLRYGCKRCILVGGQSRITVSCAVTDVEFSDPNQLPPTVMSRVATAAGYEKSLFVRMMDRGGPTAVHLLSSVLALLLLCAKLTGFEQNSIPNASQYLDFPLFRVLQLSPHRRTRNGAQDATAVARLSSLPAVRVHARPRRSREEGCFRSDLEFQRSCYRRRSVRSTSTRLSYDRL